MSKTTYKLAEDFAVGDEVYCVDPEHFIAEKRNYLRDRVGIVAEVWPSVRKTDAALRRNELMIEWQQRNGRGKVKRIVMHPRDLDFARNRQAKSAEGQS